MKQEQEKQVQAIHLWLGILGGACVFLLIVLYFIKAGEDDYDKKVQVEAKQVKELQNLLKKNGGLLFSATPGSQKKVQDLSSLVENMVKETELTSWMERLEPLQKAGENKVRITFRDIPFDGVTDFFLALEKKNVPEVEEEQVLLNLSGRGEDRWRVIIVLKHNTGDKKK